MINVKQSDYFSSSHLELVLQPTILIEFNLNLNINISITTINLNDNHHELQHFDSLISQPIDLAQTLK